jgi:membrane protease YdiL (CAAX protease family)
MAPEPDRSTPREATERHPALALLPVAATLIFYVFPPSVQEQILPQFAPQLLAYSALGLWAFHNSDILSRLGLTGAGIRGGLRWGLMTGLILGCLNTVVLLIVVPSLGYDISFLTKTPHARMPFLLMVPWFICAIAVFVEINFRGFLLGRLARLESSIWKPGFIRDFSPLALLTSALTFAFDPFMVNTFRFLHWVALWDGMIWGMIWLRTGNLFLTIIAHAVEVIVMYLAVRAALT